MFGLENNIHTIGTYTYVHIEVSIHMHNTHTWVPLITLYGAHHTKGHTHIYITHTHMYIQTHTYHEYAFEYA